MKCKICGKSYVENKNLLMLPKSLQEKLKYIADCDCEYKAMQETENERLKKEWIEDRKKASILRIQKYKNISVYDEKFFNSTFENSEENNYKIYALKYAENFLIKENPPGILFYGKVGTGKTHLAGCIANHLMKNGKTVLTLNLSRYLGKLRQDWSEAENDILNHVEKVNLLIIDDLGVENMTAWTYEKIFNLIDKRYRSNKACIITTNLNFNEDENKNELSIKFKDNFGNDRIGDRIKEMCFPILIKGESRRKSDRDRFMDFLS